MKQIGISPKVVVDFLVTVAAFLVTTLPFGLDPVLAATISKIVGSIAAFYASPGVVVPADDIHPAAADDSIPSDLGDKGSL